VAPDRPGDRLAAWRFLLTVTTGSTAMRNLSSDAQRRQRSSPSLSWPGQVYTNGVVRGGR
jgi:hypothetical protein